MSTDRIELRPVTSFLAVSIMRGIRNECRDYMTNNTQHITVLQQTRWWKEIKDDPTWMPYLLYVNHAPVGYGIVRIKDGRHWVTGGIVESVRGKGYGRWLFARLTEIAAKDHHAYLEVRSDNKRAIGLYRSLGYRFLGEARPGVLLMRATPG